MAQISSTDSKIKWMLNDAGGNPCFGIAIASEGTSSAYPVLVLSDASTTFYIWPMVTTGQLRYSTTFPSTRASDGTAVGS